jgi:hypothetical protein
VTRDVAARLNADPLGVAVVVAVVSGALAAYAPFFDGLVLALAALGTVAWVGRAPIEAFDHRRPSKGWPGVRRTLPLLTVALGALAFFLLDRGAWTPWRGLALGLSTIPLWWSRGTKAGARAG